MVKRKTPKRLDKVVLEDEQKNDMHKVTTHLENFSINYSLEMYHFFEFSERCILKESFSFYKTIE